MKARLPAASHLTRKQRAIIDQVFGEYMQAAMPEAFRRYMMLTAIVLNQSNGFGKQRLERVFDTLGNLVVNCAPEDDVFWDHVEQRCCQLGLQEYFKKNERSEKNDNMSYLRRDQQPQGGA